MRKVSFKISKNGTRYCPKAKPNPSVFEDKEVDDTTSSSVFKPHHHHQLVPARVQCDIDLSKKPSVVDLTEDDDDEDIEEIPDADVSFIVNIFPDGYTIDKTLESIAAHQIALMYNPKLLRPFDRASQSLFRAIKCCRVPVNFFEDIPCNYKNGKVACEVRDWRKDSSEQAGVSINGPPSIAATPSIRRISLRMSVDSIVRDIPQMSNRDFWPYSELMEAESKILLALYPKLDLDPFPNFDRLCKKPTTVKLNLDFRAMRQKRLRLMMSVAEKSNLRTDPNVANPATQNVGQGTAMDLPNSVNLATQNVLHIPTMHQLTQNVRQLPRMDQVGQCRDPSPRNHAPNTSIPKFPWVSHQPEDQFNAPGASSTHGLVNLSSGNDGINSLMSVFEGGRGNQDGLPSSSMANSDHRNQSNPLSFVGNQQQKIASHNALGASSSAPGASSTHVMQSARANQDRQSSFMSNSNNRYWRDPLALIGNHQQMTLEILDNTPGTAFNALRASDTRRRSFVSAFDGRTVNQDGQSSFPMGFLDGRRSRSNSLVFLGNQQQLQASHIEHNNALGTSSNGKMNLNSNSGGASSSSLVNVDNRHNRNWSNPLADVANPLASVGFQHQQIAANQQHGMLSSGSDNNDLWSFMSALASVPATDGRQPTDVITIDDDEPFPRRSSSRPPISGESSGGATRRQYRATPGNVVGTVLNIGGGNSMVAGQGSGNVRRGAPRAGRRPGAAPSASGRSRGQSSIAGGSHGGNLHVPSGSGSRGRDSRGRGSRGQGSRGRGTNITPNNNVNPRQRNDTGQQPRMALSKPSALGEFGEQSSNTGEVRIGNMNIDPSLISGSGCGGSASRGLQVRSTSGTSSASDMNHMQSNAMALPRFMSEMNQNQNQMQQQTNLQPASVSTSVNSGASRPSLNATHQDGASSSKDWMDEEFMRNLMT